MFIEQSILHRRCIHQVLSTHKTHTETGIDSAIKENSKISKEINQTVFSDGIGKIKNQYLSIIFKKLYWLGN